MDEMRAMLNQLMGDDRNEPMEVRAKKKCDDAHEYVQVTIVA